VRSGTYKYPCTVPVRGQINRAFAITRECPVVITAHLCWIPLRLRASSNNLFGPIAYISIGGSKYCLVIVDDYSRFT
jgi:hypothetical protein